MWCPASPLYVQVQDPVCSRCACFLSTCGCWGFLDLSFTQHPFFFQPSLMPSSLTYLLQCHSQGKPSPPGRELGDLFILYTSFCHILILFVSALVSSLARTGLSSASRVKRPAGDTLEVAQCNSTRILTC